jgi:hypothetical protein
MDVTEAYRKSVRRGYGRSRGVQNMWMPQECDGMVWVGRALAPEAYRISIRHDYVTYPWRT